MFKFLARKHKIVAPAAAATEPQAPAAPPPAPGGGEGFHVPYGKLPRETVHRHYAITSMREELEAVDWYRQRAADVDDAALKAILLHNAKEEIEHFAMLLEWTRRSDPEFAHELKEYLFSEGPITEAEKKAMGRE